MNLFFQVQKFPTKTSTPSRGKNVQKSSDFYRLSIENFFHLHKEEVQATFPQAIQAMVPRDTQAMVPQVIQETYLQAKDLPWDLEVQEVLGVQVVQVHQAQATCHPVEEE